MLPSGIGFRCCSAWSAGDHDSQLNRQDAEPNSGDQWKGSVLQWMAHLLQEPRAAIQRSEHPCVEAKIHDPFEMPVRRVIWIGRAVPADRHCITEGDFLILPWPGSG